MWSMLSFLWSVIIGLLRLKKSEDAPDAKVRKAAEINRETRKETYEELSDAKDDTDRDLDRLSRTDSVRDEHDAVQQAIDRANRAGR